MTIRVTITADQMAMMTKTAKNRDAWVERYEDEIEAIKRNGMRLAMEEHEDAVKSGDAHRIQFTEGRIRYINRLIAHKRKMINKLNALTF